MDNNRIPIALVDDHKLFRKGLISLLGKSPRIEVILEANHGAEFLQQLKAGAHPRVVLLDISMPEMDGVETLKALRVSFPEIRVVMLTMNHDDAMILHLLELGANGYLLKESDPEEVEAAIQSVVDKGFYINDRVSRAMLSRIAKSEHFKPAFEGPVQLTDREIEVLDQVCRGCTNPEIGEKLFISQRTVEGHRKNIMEKMGVHNTAAMIVYAIKRGWVELSDIDL